MCSASGSSPPGIITKTIVILNEVKDLLLLCPPIGLHNSCHPERSEGPTFAIAFAFCLPFPTGIHFCSSKTGRKAIKKKRREAGVGKDGF
jgi:hypothetical protein